MTTQETLKEYGLPSTFISTINLIDFIKLDTFVAMLGRSLIDKYGKNVVKNAIDQDDFESEVSTLLTHIIEVGGLKIFADCQLHSTDKIDINKIAVIIGLSMNFSLANELRKYGVYNLDSYNYYNLEAIDVLIERLGNSINAGNPEDISAFKYYSTEMVKTYLFNKF